MEDTEPRGIEPLRGLIFPGTLSVNTGLLSKKVDGCIIFTQAYVDERFQWESSIPITSERLAAVQCRPGWVREQSLVILDYRQTGKFSGSPIKTPHTGDLISVSLSHLR